MTKSIWFDQSPLGVEYPSPGLQKHLGIELTDAGRDWLQGRMPVDERTRQPFGRLHGGASVAFAETLASVASVFVIDRSQKTIVGLEINANHLRGVTDGYVIGTARPLHIGRTTMVWEVHIEDEAGKPVCISRCTIAVIDLPPKRS